MSRQFDTDVLIVGAGIAGLMAANALLDQGRRVIVLDQGRSVGGRLATRRIGPGRADHGAQFFTVRTPEFQDWVDRWQRQGLVFIWSRWWSDGSLMTVPPDGNPRYAVHGGMNALAGQLSQGIDVRTNWPVAALTFCDGGWQAQAADGQTLTGRGLLLTPPVPQSLALLPADAVIDAVHRAALDSITYAPCLAGMFWLEGAFYLPQPGALQRPEMPITWIADNQRKGISLEAALITVHAGANYSRRLWDCKDAVVLEELQQALQVFMGGASRTREAQLKRWRYSFPENSYPQRYLLASEAPPLAFAGDAFGGPRVEGAALSGMAAGSTLAACLVNA